MELKIGDNFGRLTVDGIAEKVGKCTYFLCKCQCGKFKRVRRDHLKSGKIRSCGCLLAEIVKITLTNGHIEKDEHRESF